MHRTKRLHIAAARGGIKSLGKLKAMLFFHPEARARLAHVAARTGSELATSRGVALDSGCDLPKLQPEHIVQQKSRALVPAIALWPRLPAVALPVVARV